MAFVTIINGRAGRDAELKRAGEHDVLEFSLADTTKRGQTEITTWYRVQVWGNYGMALAGQILKGDPISVSGRQILREYDDRDGNKRTSLEVSADQVQAPYREKTNEPDRTPEPPDDDIPF